MIVCFTVNNRPQYLKETLESWSRVRGIGDAHLIFRCEPGCPETLEMCGAVDFAPRTVVRNFRRFGALGNPWRAFRSGFAALPGGQGDFVILAEDDSPVADDVLAYFGWASERYQDRPDALGVCAFQRHLQPGGKHAVSLVPWFRPTVWGTWRDRWEQLLSPDWDFDYRYKGWDWRIIEHWIGEKGYRFAAPAESRSQVSGEFGGTHLNPGADYQEHLSRCFSPSYPPGEFTEV